MSDSDQKNPLSPSINLEILITISVRHVKLPTTVQILFIVRACMFPELIRVSMHVTYKYQAGWTLWSTCMYHTMLPPPQSSCKRLGMRKHTMSLLVEGSQLCQLKFWFQFLVTQTVRGNQKLLKKWLLVEVCNSYWVIDNQIISKDDLENIAKFNN